jgi:DNA repair exonuclease SbcCD ATPase subunit
MYRLLSIELENIIYFKHVFIEVSAPLTFVRGENLDSSHQGGNCEIPTTNGTGKSLLFSCPSNVFYFAPPTAQRKRAKKDLLGLKNAAITVEFLTPDGRHYLITQTAKEYFIIEDDVDLAVKRDAEEIIKQVWSISSVDFYSYCYVSSQRPYPIQTDSDIARLDTLTHLFRLDEYDLIKQKLSKKLASIKNLEAKLSVLQQQVVQTKNYFKEAKLRLSKSRSKSELEAQLSELKQEYDEVVTKLEACLTKVAFYTEFADLEQKLDAYRSNYSYTQPPEVTILDLEAQLDAVSSQETYNQLLQAYETSVASLTKELRSIEIPKNFDVQHTERNYDKISAKLKKYKKLAASLEQDKTHHLKLANELSTAREKLAGIEKPHNLDCISNESNCRTLLKLQAILDEVSHKDQQCECPTCYQTLDIKAMKKLVKQAELDLQEIEQAKKYIRLKDTVSGLKTEIDELGYSEQELQECLNIISTLKSEKQELEDLLQDYDDIQRIKAQLKKIKKPVQPDLEFIAGYSKKVDVLKRDIRQCSEIISVIAQKSNLLASAKLQPLKTLKAVKTAISENEAQVKVLQARKSTLLKQLDATHEAFRRYSVSSSECETLSSTLTSLTDEITKISSNVKDKQLLETLVKAYSSKGLKTQHANSICALLEQNLNLYSHLVFAENFTFEVTASESGMSIIVFRGNTGLNSDVRTLSGAESNSFRLLFVLSLLILVPSDRRMDTLILDEPCSHQDSVSRNLFITRYLPFISEIVPKVVVITPNQDDVLEGACEIIVTKENGMSSITVNN